MIRVGQLLRIFVVCGLFLGAAGLSGCGNDAEVGVTGVATHPPGGPATLTPPASRTPTITQTATRTVTQTFTRSPIARTATPTRSAAVGSATPTPTATATVVNGGSDCCVEHAGLGCDEEACEACVCGPAGDSFCCDVGWDGTCVEIAQAECAGNCTCAP